MSYDLGFWSSEGVPWVQPVPVTNENLSPRFRYRFRLYSNSVCHRSHGVITVLTLWSEMTFCVKEGKTTLPSDLPLLDPGSEETRL